MAAAIEVLHPQWVVIENVRGLLAATAIRPAPEGDNDARRNPATARAAAVRNLEPDPWGLETSQLDLYGHLAPFSETWPTSGTMHDGSARPLPPSAHHIPDSESSSSRGALFRTPLASDSARGNEPLEQVRARRGTITLSHQVIDIVRNLRTIPSPETTFALIEDFFDAGDAMLRLSPDGSASVGDRLQRPLF